MSNIITIKEQKKLMLDMLKYIDSVCRKNGIKYSLIGGSLIGAVRNQGYIPWDDDIDIILTEKNFRKLVDILDKETGRYQTFKYGKECEKMGFRKLIDTKTHVLESDFAFDPDYGVFVDIFSYCDLSNDIKKNKRLFSEMKWLLRLVVYYREKPGLKRFVSRVIGCKRISRAYEKIRKSTSSDANYTTCFFPVYGFSKEVQLKKNTEDYIDVKFEDLTVMIFKNYDEILRTTFGDYMKLPPKSERASKHNIKAWWRE